MEKYAFKTIILFACMFIVVPFAKADPPSQILEKALKNNSISLNQMGSIRGQGVILQSSSNSGQVNGFVGSGSETGKVYSSNSINSNSGITTVFQNSGNNALIQNSMTINVTMH